MDITFVSDVENRLSLSLDNGRRLIMKNGSKTLTDKEDIRGLMRHELYRNGSIRAIQPEDEINDYLADKKSVGFLTSEVLESVTDSGLIALGDHFQSKSRYPETIKAEITNSPMTTAVQAIVNKYQKADMVMEMIEETEEKLATKRGRPSKKDE